MVFIFIGIALQFLIMHLLYSNPSNEYALTGPSSEFQSDGFFEEEELPIGLQSQYMMSTAPSFSQ